MLCCDPTVDFDTLIVTVPCRPRFRWAVTTRGGENVLISGTKARLLLAE